MLERSVLQCYLPSVLQYDEMILYVTSNCRDRNKPKLCSRYVSPLKNLLLPTMQDL